MVKRIEKMVCIFGRAIAGRGPNIQTIFSPILPFYHQPFISYGLVWWGYEIEGLEGIKEEEDEGHKQDYIWAEIYLTGAQI